MAIGQSVPMVDARERVSGQVEYVLNLELPGMLHARILRSPHPHARLLRIDTTQAQLLPGVRAVLSRNDLLDQDRFSPHYGPYVRDQTVVALEKVHFVGEPVAAVAAIEEDVAEEALDRISVEYEELQPVFDPEEALASGAPILHEEPLVASGRREAARRSLQGTNLCHTFRQRRGDVEEGFRESDLVFENTFSTPPVEHVPLEPHVAVVQVRERQVTVWSSCQSPYTVQSQIAEIFRVPLSDVRVIVLTLGGGFGAKGNVKLEPIAALLAWKAQAPVKVALTRNEDFLVVTQQAAKIKLKTGVKRDGTLVTVQGTCYFNAGPYADTTPNVIARGYACTGPYRVPNVWVDSYAVYTNALPAGAFRGYGMTQVAWAHECQMDIIADSLGIDPLELRLKNVLQRGDPFSTGEPMPDLHYPHLLNESASRIGWSEGPLRVVEGSRVRAKGISAILKGSATPTTSSAMVKLNGDGSLSVLTSSVEMGQGAKTALTQIAAHEAELPMAKVRMSEVDTAVTPYDQMTAASRTTSCMGTAVRLAVQDVKRQLLELGAELLEVGKEDLILQDGRLAVRGAPDRSISYSDVVRRSRRGNLLGYGYFATKGGLDPETGQGVASAQWHPAVVACEVEVDTETGGVQVTRLHVGLYVGTAINPRLCELQVEGSVAFGLGQALFEEVVLDTNGQLTNANLSDYMIPSFHDLPSNLTVHLLESPESEEVHGIGETALPPVGPAIGNAVSRAIGVRIFDLPLTQEKVLRALERTEHSVAEDAVRAAS